MSLTTGRGPFSSRPAGQFDPPVPAGVVYVEPFRRRVRGRAGGQVVVDSERAVLVHRAGEPPAYAFPASDVAAVESAAEPAAAGYVRVAWDAVDSWFEEDEEVFMHPRNPYHRVDCVRTSRRLRVAVAGTALVDTTETMGVYETALDPRLYAARAHIRMDLLRPSTTVTYCPYKGTASYFHALVGGREIADVAWSYADPLPESRPIAGLLAFDPARAEVAQELPSPAVLGAG
jgi:uncharacterized protein (DUF427 family)